jgi:hypothetical protein
MQGITRREILLQNKYFQAHQATARLSIQSLFQKLEAFHLDVSIGWKSENYSNDKLDDKKENENKYWPLT